MIKICRGFGPCFSLSALHGFYRSLIEHLMFGRYSDLVTETRTETVLWIFLTD